MATIVADNNVNETDGTVYNFPRSTGNQDTLAAALQAVIDRKAGAPTRAVTRIELVLPPPIATHLATDTGDANTVARCFREDALVVDEHRAHRGYGEIADGRPTPPQRATIRATPFRCRPPDATPS